jgi:hypothetical protein
MLDVALRPVLVVLALCLVRPVVAAQPEPEPPVPLGVSAQTASAISRQPVLALSNTLGFALTFPGARDCYLTAPTSTWFHLGQVEWDLAVSEGAPTNIQLLVFMKDWDYLWHQQLLPGFAVPGVTNRYRVDLSPSAPNWSQRGHHAAWGARALMAPVEFGVRVFSDSPGGAVCRIERVAAIPRPPDTAPPFIRNVRPSASEVGCHEKFEVTFDLPDRYANPFDPEEVDVAALIETPATQTVSIAGFHSLNYYRRVTPTGEETLPQGPPHWRIRYAPPHPGVYRYRLRVRDARGVADWGPGSFVARPPTQPGYVRVSKADPRHFEFDNGRFFFPIGHNIRSPSDERLNTQFPWTKRWEEGSAAYARFFTAMREHGENLAEVWMAAWSLGLEWSPLWRGYHGIGQYNLMHAWELDRVFDEADRNGIYLNLVIHNHGKFATRLDAEWDHNPFNTKLGGFLDSPNRFFDDPRAMKAFETLMRYIVARWGYSPRLFAWELWSELNLTGTGDGVYRQQACVDWHRRAADAIRAMDPNDHLITTHYSNDYNSQNTAITALPEISHVSVDAYYGNPQALQIVDLLAATAQFNNPYRKPVMVTEFGGAWNAQGLAHLENSLHAGLWASTCTPIAGAPLFWWWGLIEEENYYPEYLAVSRFMKDEDRRDPALVAYTPALIRPGSEDGQVQACAMKSGTRALGWIYDRAAYNNQPSGAHRTNSNVRVQLEGLSNGVYRVEFWNTAEGIAVDRQTVAVKDGTLSAKAPPFARDLGFKARKSP